MTAQREPKVGRRPGNQDTRGQIITAARHAFAAKGFAGTSMRGIASLSAHLRTWLVGDRAHQESKSEFARTGAVGLDGPHHDVAEVESKDVRIGTVIEDYLERELTVFCDTDDQHLVTMT